MIKGLFFTKKLNKKEFFYIALLGILFNIFGTLFINSLKIPDKFLLDHSLEVKNILKSRFYYVFLTIICSPIFEEIVFRKFLLNFFKKINLIFGVAFSSLLFGILHGHVISSTYAFFASLILCAIYIKYNNDIKSSILFHSSFNASSMLFLFMNSEIENFIKNKFFLYSVMLVLVLFIFKLLKKIFYHLE